jgi:hypothetical protein
VNRTSRDESGREGENEDSQMGATKRGLGEHESRRRRAQETLERYRYLLRTAPPDAIEHAHTEAFAQLTKEERAQVFWELGEELPLAERTVRPGPGQADPNSLARMATRAELRQPGALERVLGGRGMGMDGGSLLSSVAGAVIGGAISHQLFAGLGDASTAEPDEAGSPDEAEFSRGAGQGQHGDVDDDMLDAL